MRDYTRCPDLNIDIQKDWTANFVNLWDDALKVSFSLNLLLTFSSKALAKTILKIFCTLME